MGIFFKALRKLTAEKERRFSMKESKKLTSTKNEKREPKGRNQGGNNAIPGINTPGVELPAFNPPVPNRAWTAMKKEIEENRD